MAWTDGSQPVRQTVGCAIVLPADSNIHSPEDLADIEVPVGYQSVSHYTTIQALEPFLDKKDIKLKFGGTPADRIDQMHQPYVHYYLNELPERHATLVDVKRFGHGERIVFEPYSKNIYESTQAWIREKDIFDGATGDPTSYEKAVVRV